MVLTTSVWIFMGSVITAALSKILVEEIGAWCPWIVRNLIKLAVACLPENQRARFDEEWQSHVSEVPGTVGKLLAAAGFLLAAYNLSQRLEHFAKTNSVKAEKLPTQEEAEQIKKEQESLIPIELADSLNNYDDSANYLVVRAFRDREAAQMRVAAMSQVASEQVFPPQVRKTDKAGTRPIRGRYSEETFAIKKGVG
jgi:hypothetical protein